MEVDWSLTVKPFDSQHGVLVLSHSSVRDWLNTVMASPSALTLGSNLRHDMIAETMMSYLTTCAFELPRHPESLDVAMTFQDRGYTAQSQEVTESVVESSHNGNTLIVEHVTAVNRITQTRINESTTGFDAETALSEAKRLLQKFGLENTGNKELVTNVVTLPPLYQSCAVEWYLHARLRPTEAVQHMVLDFLDVDNQAFRSWCYFRTFSKLEPHPHWPGTPLDPIHSAFGMSRPTNAFPLYCASYFHLPWAIKPLVDKGGDPNALAGTQGAPLHAALCGRSPQQIRTLKQLLYLGGDIERVATTTDAPSKASPTDVYIQPIDDDNSDDCLPAFRPRGNAIQVQRLLQMDENFTKGGLRRTLARMNPESANVTQVTRF
jgi:hypothetical protein